MAVQDPRIFPTNGNRQAVRGVGNTTRIAVLERRGGSGGGGGGGGGPLSGEVTGAIGATTVVGSQTSSPQFGDIQINPVSGNADFRLVSAAGLKRVLFDAATTGVADWTLGVNATPDFLLLGGSDTYLQAFTTPKILYSPIHPGNNAIAFNSTPVAWTGAGGGTNVRFGTDYNGGFSGGIGGRGLSPDDKIYSDVENGGGAGNAFTNWIGYGFTLNRYPFFNGVGTTLGHTASMVVGDQPAVSILSGTAGVTSSGADVLVTTSAAHGLAVNDSVFIGRITGGPAGLNATVRTVKAVPSSTTYTITTPAWSGSAGGADTVAVAAASTGITASGTSVLVTTTGVHGLETGDVITFDGTVTPAALQNTTWVITKVSTTTFTLRGSTFTTTGGGGSIIVGYGRRLSYHEATAISGFMTNYSYGANVRAAELDVHAVVPGRNLGVMISMTRAASTGDYSHYANTEIFGANSPWLRTGDVALRLQNSTDTTTMGTGLWIVAAGGTAKIQRPICFNQGAGTNVAGTDLFTVDQLGNVGIRTATDQSSNPSGFPAALTIGYTSAAAASTSSADGINFGGDVKLYRSGTASLTADHSAATGGAFSVFMPTTLGAAQTGSFIGASPAGNQSIAINASGGVRGLRVEGAYTITGEPNTQSFVGIQVNPTITLSSTTTSDLNNVRGVASLLTVNPTASTTYTNVSAAAEQVGTFRSLITLNTASSATQTIAGFVAGYAMDGPVVDTGWTVANLHGFRVGAPTGSGVITSAVGLDVEDLAAFPGTKTNRPIGLRSVSPVLITDTQSTAASPRTIQGNSANVALEVDSTTRAILFPRMDDTARNAMTAINGMVIYNTSSAKFEGYEGGAWMELSTGAAA